MPGPGCALDVILGTNLAMTPPSREYQKVWGNQAAHCYQADIRQAVFQ